MRREVQKREKEKNRRKFIFSKISSQNPRRVRFFRSFCIFFSVKCSRLLRLSFMFFNLKEKKYQTGFHRGESAIQIKRDSNWNDHDMQNTNNPRTTTTRQSGIEKSKRKIKKGGKFEARKISNVAVFPPNYFMLQ